MNNSEQDEHYRHPITGLLTQITIVLYAVECEDGNYWEIAKVFKRGQSAIDYMKRRRAECANANPPKKCPVFVTNTQYVYA